MSPVRRPPRWDPTGRVAVVTGASSGIGAATTLRLAALGMHVVAVARRTDRLTALADGHPRILPVTADVADTADVDRLVATVTEAHGACHALINNAGVGGGPLRGRADLDTSLATLEINLGGMLRCTAGFADLLAASAPARVVNVASVAGKIGVGPPAYVASKFAMVGASEALATAWAGRGVTVCQLNPGFIATEGFPQRALLASPLRRLIGRPEDVARAIHEVLVTGATERTVPRWYRAVVVTRHLAPPVYRLATAPLTRSDTRSDARSEA